MESNALQQNSLQKNRQKSGIDCNVIAVVSGLRCTLSKTAVQRNPLQKIKIPTFGTLMGTFQVGAISKAQKAQDFFKKKLEIFDFFSENVA